MEPAVLYPLLLFVVFYMILQEVIKDHEDTIQVLTSRMDELELQLSDQCLSDMNSNYSYSINSTLNTIPYVMETENHLDIKWDVITYQLPNNFSPTDRCVEIYNDTLFIFSDNFQKLAKNSVAYAIKLDRLNAQINQDMWQQYPMKNDVSKCHSSTKLNEFVYISPTNSRNSNNNKNNKMVIFDMKNKIEISENNFQSKLPIPWKNKHKYNYKLHGMCTVNDEISNIYLIGGRYANKGYSNKLFIYNINKNEWSFGNDMINDGGQGRAFFTCHYYKNKIINKSYIIVISGENVKPQEVNTIEIYDIKQNKWYELDKQLKYSRRGHSSILVPTNKGEIKIIVWGGLPLKNGKNVEIIKIFDNFDMKSEITEEKISLPNVDNVKLRDRHMKWIPNTNKFIMGAGHVQPYDMHVGEMMFT